MASSPYNSWKESIKNCFDACVQSYNYDDRERDYPWKSINEYRAKNIASFRMNERYSNDQVVVYENATAMIVAFRGTDTADPRRFLGGVFPDYLDKIIKTFEKVEPRVANPQIPQKLKDRMFFQLPLDLGPKDICSNALPDPNAKDRVTIMTKVNNSYCDFIQGALEPLYTPEDRAKAVYFQRANIVKKYTSDCSMDHYITTSSKFGTLHSRSIESYVIETRQFVDSLQYGTKHVYFTGHSLGGFKALYACSIAKLPVSRMTYYGFNPASTSIFKNVASYSNPTFAIFRTYHDVVSYQYAEDYEKTESAGSVIDNFGITVPVTNVTYKKIYPIKIIEYIPNALNRTIRLSGSALAHSLRAFVCQGCLVHGREGEAKGFSEHICVQSSSDYAQSNAGLRAAANIGNAASTVGNAVSKVGHVVATALTSALRFGGGASPKKIPRRANKYALFVKEFAARMKKDKKQFLMADAAQAWRSRMK